ncbi:FliM/FliN family flagellar motor switch protein [Sphingobium subterraneum]|uniref:Flagellar motor switch protein FliN/FliY n=1 Tax=Sphingobium subterraneum TaxID=627688 RepID=A0A841J0Z5_9SPHN|nr:FliM/FliN family flagellar motor switch protein [Sphingobium subterraneum]MBB6124310.1 flagellar motor switch protein FliN/FliY [Sphingobium subterraneum]
MSAIDGIEIELSIALGSTALPIRQILGMSRGAMIALDCGQDDPSLVFVNGQLVAKGQVLVDEDRMSLEITEVMKREL